MRHCEHCGFLRVEGYEYPESYCKVGIREDDPKFDEDKDGCGCHYNLRTLRKIEKELDHMEYLSYLGYDDYMLMPTMEYTDENEAILEEHRELVRHALGMDNRKAYKRHGKKFYKPYRNYFQTGTETTDYPYWERLVKAGLAEKREVRDNVWYYVTRRGMDWLGLHDRVHIYDKER